MLVKDGKFSETINIGSPIPYGRLRGRLHWENLSQIPELHSYTSQVYRGFICETFFPIDPGKCGFACYGTENGGAMETNCLVTALLFSVSSLNFALSLATEILVLHRGPRKERSIWVRPGRTEQWWLTSGKEYFLATKCFSCSFLVSLFNIIFCIQRLFLVQQFLYVQLFTDQWLQPLLPSPSARCERSESGTQFVNFPVSHQISEHAHWAQAIYCSSYLMLTPLTLYLWYTKEWKWTAHLLKSYHFALNKPQNV